MALGCLCHRALKVKPLGVETITIGTQVYRAVGRVTNYDRSTMFHRLGANIYHNVPYYYRCKGCKNSAGLEFFLQKKLYEISVLIFAPLFKKFRGVPAFFGSFCTRKTSALRRIRVLVLSLRVRILTPFLNACSKYNGANFNPFSFHVVQKF